MLSHATRKDQGPVVVSLSIGAVQENELVKAIYGFTVSLHNSENIGFEAPGPGIAGVQIQVFIDVLQGQGVGSVVVVALGLNEPIIGILAQGGRNGYQEKGQEKESYGLHAP